MSTTLKDSFEQSAKQFNDVSEDSNLHWARRTLMDL